MFRLGAGRKLDVESSQGQRTRSKQMLSNNMERGVLKQRDGKRVYRVLQASTCWRSAADAEIAILEIPLRLAKPGVFIPSWKDFALLLDQSPSDWNPRPVGAGGKGSWRAALRPDLKLMGCQARTWGVESSKKHVWR